MTRTLEQEYALRTILNWSRDPSAKQSLVVQGAAGTGKTSLLRDLVADLPQPVAFAAFTGKAASVMKSNGCTGATTPHRLLYRPFERTDKDGRRIVDFVINQRGPASEAAIICIDEGSMVGPALTRDLLSFRKKLLVLGDPFQLPHIEGESPFMKAKPDVLLTTIHRQAADNPIIALATHVRQGKLLKPGVYGNSLVMTSSEIDPSRVFAADQVLVGTNALRHRLIRRLRQMRGSPDGAPVVGDRLVCLRNDSSRRLDNGTIWIVSEVLERRPDGAFHLDVKTGGNAGLPSDLKRRISVRQEYFTGSEAKLPSNVRTDHFGFADALSVHKSQGSQWDAVALFDDSDRFGDQANRLLYTGLTRASKHVTVIARPIFR